jgi:hypothetical protein
MKSRIVFLKIIIIIYFYFLNGKMGSKKPYMNIFNEEATVARFEGHNPCLEFLFYLIGELLEKTLFSVDYYIILNSIIFQT